jgi:hypothetical protein
VAGDLATIIVFAGTGLAAFANRFRSVGLPLFTYGLVLAFNYLIQPAHVAAAAWKQASDEWLHFALLTIRQFRERCAWQQLRLSLGWQDCSRRCRCRRSVRL